MLKPGVKKYGKQLLYMTCKRIEIASFGSGSRSLSAPDVTLRPCSWHLCSEDEAGGPGKEKAEEIE